MRIVSGTLKGRVIRSDDVAGLRPTTEKVREAIFSSLQSLTDIENASVLDLYAGTGSLGIEALSRGAAKSTFVEKQRKLCDRLKSTVADLGVDRQARILCSDALKFLQAPDRASSPFDIVFADPPYAEHPGLEIARLLLGGFVREGSVLVLESSSSTDLQPGRTDSSGGLSAIPLKDKIYGDTLVSYFRFESTGDSDNRGEQPE
ncbi:MAG: 16S rRNA (guanine(966)-N(2))-methyltransferase RsmD [Bdellovibrionota bacterium]